MTGERAEMSKERRYESKLSREMLKGSLSEKALRLLVVLRDELLVQKDLRSSGGEGGRKTPLSLISGRMLVGWGGYGGSGGRERLAA
jgi:hypothetical protein